MAPHPSSVHVAPLYAPLQLVHGRSMRWTAGHQVLATAEANKALIRLDPLQKLHTLSNLADLLEGRVPGIPRTLRDDSLRADADSIREVRRFSELLHSQVQTD